VPNHCPVVVDSSSSCSVSRRAEMEEVRARQQSGNCQPTTADRPTITHGREVVVFALGSTLYETEVSQQLELFHAIPEDAWQVVRGSPHRCAGKGAKICACNRNYIGCRDSCGCECAAQERWRRIGHNETSRIVLMLITRGVRAELGTAVSSARCSARQNARGMRCPVYSLRVEACIQASSNTELFHSEVKR